MSSVTPQDDARDDVARLPREPYPGLRPFLDYEGGLLLGRERQVREVIARLQETQFVAVIGGSGSGKSSLMHAGVVPALRSFGIRDAGDFWLTMACTPGTNLSSSDAAQARHTPIRRLAWKFAQLLKPVTPESKKTDEQRLDDIATVFRQEAGFARLMEAYASELKLPPGPKPEDVRLLFVLDQFEELFHPSNQGLPDVRLLVERVIDHFFSPHARCYVVLTMRSEHLNDCAGYLELPDAINKSSYLVRRLDDDELTEAIVDPAQRFLRLLRRRDLPDDDALPDAVTMAPAVIERLQRDVGTITHDPDHLPLLQHLLARIWEAARDREKVRASVPHRIEWSDLRRAVFAIGAVDSPAAQEPAEAPIDPDINVLRASLENWAEAIYLRHPPARREQLDSVLRRLALKDPNTGMYTQQRIDVDDPTLFDGEAAPRETLRALVADGFIGSVDYLFWDDENPTRVTLKVSHESFIRGWSRIRKWADEEDRQFQIYLRVLEDCTRWIASGRQDARLATGDTLRLYQDAELETGLLQPDRLTRYARLLAMDRDGPRVAAAAAEAPAFLKLSRENGERLATERDVEAERQRAARQRMRRVKQSRWAAFVLLVGVLGFLWTEWLLARKERTLHQSYALAAETQVAFQGQFQGFESAQPPLHDSLTGAFLLDLGQSHWTGPAAWWGPRAIYSSRVEGLTRTELLSEVRNIATLRNVLQGSAWQLPAQSGPPLAPPAPRGSWPCHDVLVGEENRTQEFGEPRFYPRGANDDRFGLVITHAGNGGMSIYAATSANDSNPCTIERQLISTPPLEPTRIVLAADQSNLVLGFGSYQQFYAILWDDPSGVQQRLRAVVTRPTPRAIEESKVVVVPSTRAAFATDLVFNSRTIRLFDMEPSPVAAADAGNGQAMVRAEPGSICDTFAQARSLGPKDVVWSAAPASGQGTVYCLHVKPALNASPDAGTPFLASLYGFADRDVAGDTEKQAPLFRELVLGAVKPDEYRIQVQEGWLAFRNADQWRAVPWSAGAWSRLAEGVFDARAAAVPPRAASAASAPASSSDASMRRMILREEIGVASLQDLLQRAPALSLRTARERGPSAQ